MFWSRAYFAIVARHLLGRHASLLMRMAKYHDPGCTDSEEGLVMIPRCACDRYGDTFNVKSHHLIDDRVA